MPEVDRYLAELSRRVCMRWKSLVRPGSNVPLKCIHTDTHLFHKTSNSDGVLTFLTANVFFPESCVALLSAPPVNVHLRMKGKPETAAITSRLHEYQGSDLLFSH